MNEMVKQIGRSLPVSNYVRLIMVSAVKFDNCYPRTGPLSKNLSGGISVEQLKLPKMFSNLNQYLRGRKTYEILCYRRHFVII